MINLKITRQGAPIINKDNIYILLETSDVIVAEIDMRSKWCEISFTSCGGTDNSLIFGISSTDRSVGLNESFNKDTETEVLIKGFDSNLWDIFSIDCRRYTIRLVLLNRKVYD